MEPKTHALTQTYTCTCSALSLSLTHTVTPSYVHFLTTSRHHTSTRILAEERVNTNKTVTLPAPPKDHIGGKAPDPRFDNMEDENQLIKWPESFSLSLECEAQVIYEVGDRERDPGLPSMWWCRPEHGLKHPRFFLYSREFSNLTRQARKVWWKIWNVRPDTPTEGVKRHSTCGYDAGHRTPSGMTRKGLHLALFSSPARSRVLQRVTIRGEPNRRQQPLALTWLRLSGCAALVPPRCARYPVGVIQHPDDCPLTEATGLVLLLRRPRKDQALVSYECTSGESHRANPQVVSYQSVHICMRFARVKVSGVSYFLNYIDMKTKTVLSISLPSCYKVHKGSSTRSHP